jgi:N-acetylmuramoyl-L-alanine amidase
MKPVALQKAAQVAVLVLLLSIMMPVLAFAASGFSNVTYKNGTVTGTVYSDVYSVNQQVYAYDPSGSYLGVAAATYSVYDDVYKYSFSLSGIGNYSYVQLYNVTDSVYQAVYRTNVDDGPCTTCGSGGGGGIGGGGVSTPAGTISVLLDGAVNADELEKALKAGGEVTLKLLDDKALIPAKALTAFKDDKSKTIRVTNENGAYLIPIHVLKLDELAKAADSDVKDLLIQVTIAKAAASTIDAVNVAAKALGAAKVAGTVDFLLQAVGKKTVAVDLGSSCVSRVLPLDKAVDPSKATGVLFNPTTNKLSFVPAVFTSQDGKHEATLKRNGSSIYTVIELSKSFTDINGHWAKSYIDLLASKLVVDGVTDSSFEPERNITRAEFAALVVRSLGLEASTGNSSFKDVNANEWYAGVVNAAAAAKLVDGYEDNTFKPNAPIKREELAAMVVRALSYAGAKPEVNSGRQEQLLSKFTDAKQIVWAQAEVAAAIEAGIIDGMTDTTIGSRELATRAQSATMLKRLLSKAGFINN